MLVVKKNGYSTEVGQKILALRIWPFDSVVSVSSASSKILQIISATDDAISDYTILWFHNYFSGIKA